MPGDHLFCGLDRKIDVIAVIDTQNNLNAPGRITAEIPQGRALKLAVLYDDENPVCGCQFGREQSEVTYHPRV